MKIIKEKIRSYSRNSDGALAVEFGLISLVFLTLLFSSLEVGRLLYTWNALQYSVEEATRLAIITDNASDAEIEQFVLDELPPIIQPAPENITVNVNYTTVSSVDFIELQGQYQYQLMIPILPSSWMNIVLPANSRMPMP